jgi:hypothetical protein
MVTSITQADIQKYIDDGIEESLALDYKSASALGNSDRQKKEITKHISAMANSAGGTIVYGVKEHDDPGKRHLPEKLEGVDRSQFSKEWLEHVINNIRPRIDGLTIYPVDLDTSPEDVIYVVEIPQSTTAHQATDYRYYKRFNFESVPMEDYEVRDVMGRAVAPDISVEFGFRNIVTTRDRHEYLLEVKLENQSAQVINHFKLEFTFSAIIPVIHRTIGDKEHIDLLTLEDGDSVVVYRSRGVLFPRERLDVGQEISWHYEITPQVHNTMRQVKRAGRDLSIQWALYADNMVPKRGVKPFDDLLNF